MGDGPAPRRGSIFELVVGDQHLYGVVWGKNRWLYSPFMGRKPLLERTFIGGILRTGVNPWSLSRVTVEHLAIRPLIIHPMFFDDGYFRVIGQITAHADLALRYPCAPFEYLPGWYGKRGLGCWIPPSQNRWAHDANPREIAGELCSALGMPFDLQWKQNPLERLQPSARLPQAGDLFTYRHRGSYGFGRVVSSNYLHPSYSARLNVVYLYRQQAPEPQPLLEELGPDSLLAPPILVDRHLWLNGFFQNLNSLPLTPADLRPYHCFFRKLWYGNPVNPSAVYRFYGETGAFGRRCRGEAAYASAMDEVLPEYLRGQAKEYLETF